MPQNPRKKRNSNARKPQRQSAPEQPSSPPEHHTRNLTHDKQQTDIRTPFYDDPNHITYGWQQMGTLPDFPGLHTLVRGAQDNTLLSFGDRLQTWLVEPQQAPDKIERGEFDQHSRHGQEPRQPRPLVEARDRSEHGRTGRPEFEPFFNPPATEPGDICLTDAGSKVELAQSVPRSEDVNQKLRIGQRRENASTLLKLTEDLHMAEPQARSRRLAVDEIRSPHHASKEAECIKTLFEEPAPPMIRKKRAKVDNPENCSQPRTLEQAQILRTKRRKEDMARLTDKTRSSEWNHLGRRSDTSADLDSSHDFASVKVTVREVQETEDEETESSTDAIIERQLSAPTKEPTCGFEHCSAVPGPLNLAAIEDTRGERPGLAKPEVRSKTVLEVDGQSNLHKAKRKSVDSFETGVSSEFEKLSMLDSSKAEHNGSRRKWYKGFRRSQ